MISVLMSVYNEELNDIKKSIDSILSQTYKDFEFIIVLDNPDFSSARMLLNDYAQKDARIKIILNEKNIGLALSMNKASESANGEYFLRMDADDISLPERFEIEIKAMESGDYDLVCSDYSFIDEKDSLLDIQTALYTDKQISRILPLRNIIHHPTVLMKASSFKALGGYRNYKCAQDYDLWLRMKINGCTFHMIDKKLLLYRVRSNSITIQHRYKQVCTLNYIHSLYHKSGKRKMQGYSYENYLQFLKKHSAENENAQKDFIKNFNLYKESINLLKRKKLFKGLKGIAKVWLFSKYYRPHIYRSIKLKFIKKFVK